MTSRIFMKTIASLTILLLVVSCGSNETNDSNLTNTPETTMENNQKNEQSDGKTVLNTPAAKGTIVLPEGVKFIATTMQAKKNGETTNVDLTLIQDENLDISFDIRGAKTAEETWQDWDAVNADMVKNLGGTLLEPEAGDNYRYVHLTSTVMNDSYRYWVHKKGVSNNYLMMIVSTSKEKAQKMFDIANTFEPAE
jgi:hypothetical protein